jgi:uncharacterized protein YbjT (DUF2867 family)
MKRILVTGGDGVLGKSIVHTLTTQGQVVRVMSRKAKPDNLPDTVEWAQADVTTGVGIDEALKDVHTIVNCMSSPMANTYETDIEGLRVFLIHAKQRNIQYLVHISIIGIDRIMYPYYQYKLGSELVVIESEIPYLISRVAQFPYFIDYLISPLRDVDKDEVAIPVDVQFQPISPADVASYLAPIIVDGTTVGRLDDFGGPEVLTLHDILSTWLEAQGINKTIKPATESENDLPFFENFGDGFVKGYNTNRDQKIGDNTWADYLKQTYIEYQN